MTNMWATLDCGKFRLESELFIQRTWWPFLSRKQQHFPYSIPQTMYLHLPWASTLSPLSCYLFNYSFLHTWLTLSIYKYFIPHPPLHLLCFLNCVWSTWNLFLISCCRLIKEQRERKGNCSLTNDLFMLSLGTRFYLIEQLIKFVILNFFPFNCWHFCW